MIDSRELRIGNWVDCYGIRFQIHELLELYATRNSEDGAFFYDKMEPIPLTPEILVACGFVELAGGDGGNWKRPEFKIWSSQNLLVGELNGEFYLYNQSEDDFYSWYSPQIKTLHHLQNIHFALTQTEITFNKNKLKTNV